MGLQFDMTPVSTGIRPVKNVLRAGEQTGLDECDSMNVVPRLIRRSALGVLTSRHPWPERASNPSWSEIMNRKFGLTSLFALFAAATFVAATDAARPPRRW